jgi:hypothetical protein
MQDFASMETPLRRLMPSDVANLVHFDFDWTVTLFFAIIEDSCFLLLLKELIMEGYLWMVECVKYQLEIVFLNFGD